MMDVQMASTAASAADLTADGAAVPAAWYALLGQEITFTDGVFVLVAVTSDGVITLQKAGS